MRMPWKRNVTQRRRGHRVRVRTGDAPAAIEVLEIRAVMAGNSTMPLLPQADVGAQMPDFQLVDDNVLSDRFGETISPREYLQQVSGWYFIHTT
jgi:hypothetical protein